MISLITESEISENNFVDAIWPKVEKSRKNTKGNIKKRRVTNK